MLEDMKIRIVPANRREHDVVIAGDLDDRAAIFGDGFKNMGENPITRGLDDDPAGCLPNHFDALDRSKCCGIKPADHAADAQDSDARGLHCRGDHAGIGGLGAEFAAKRKPPFPAAQQ